MASYAIDILEHFFVCEYLSMGEEMTVLSLANGGQTCWRNVLMKFRLYAVKKRQIFIYTQLASKIVLEN